MHICYTHPGSRARPQERSPLAAGRGRLEGTGHQNDNAPKYEEQKSLRISAYVHFIMPVIRRRLTSDHFILLTVSELFPRKGRGYLDPSTDALKTDIISNHRRHKSNIGKALAILAQVRNLVLSNNPLKR